MPDGTIAIATETGRRARGKKAKPLTEEQLIALCDKTIAAEKAWAAANGKVNHLQDSEWPEDVRRDQEFFGNLSAQGMQQICRAQATSPASLKAKAAAVLATFYDEPVEHPEMWSVLKDAAAISLASDTPKIEGKGSKLLEMVARYLKIDEEMWDLENSKPNPGAHKAIYRLLDKNNKLMKKIIALPALSLEEIQAKAHALKAFTADPPQSSPFLQKDDDYLDSALITSILNDLVRGRPQDVVSAASPDAELINVCDGHAATKDAVNLGDSSLEWDDPIWQAYRRSVDTIEAARPQTMAGVLAKARAAKAEALERDGTESPEHTPAADIAWGIVNDLLRLHGKNAPENPDASLIKLCAEHIANYSAFNDDERDLEAKDNPFWHAYMRTFNAFTAARPQTLSGLIAKARVIKTEAKQPDGYEEIESEVHQMWDLVNDLIRIGEETAA